MAGRDGESNGQGSGSFHAGSVVLIGSGSEHDHKQDERDKELDPEGLTGI